VSIIKTASPDPVKAGEILTYTVTVTNAGPAAAQKVVVIDTLPPSLTYISDTDRCREGPSRTLTCDLGDIPAGGSVTFQIFVRVSESPTGPITNVAIVLTETFDRDVNDRVATTPTVLEEVAPPTLTPTATPIAPAATPVVPPGAGAFGGSSAGTPLRQAQGTPWWLYLAAGGSLALMGAALLVKALADRLT